MWLTEADETIRDAMTPVRVHPKLLPIEFVNDQQLPVALARQRNEQALLRHAGNGAEIAPKIPELLPQALPELSFPRLPGFRDPQVRLSHLLPIGAGLLCPTQSSGMQMIDDRFGFLTGVIEEFEVGGVGDIRRHTGGIDEELAARRSGLVSFFRGAPVRGGRIFCGWGILGRLGVGDQLGNGLVDCA